MQRTFFQSLDKNWGKFTRRIKDRPLVGYLAREIYFRIARRGFPGSAIYWERRYQTGRDSGAGSLGRLAHFKAEILNNFVRAHNVESVIEYGCGDGMQLSLTNYPRYHGVDVSSFAVEQCRNRFSDDHSKTFDLKGSTTSDLYDLALSLDVIYHLVEDDVFDRYMTTLFSAARRFVIIYSSNKDAQAPEPHVRHREFISWVAARHPEWVLREVVPNRFPFDRRNTDETSFADFYIFEKSHQAD
jgi:hypothetical protein